MDLVGIDIMDASTSNPSGAVLCNPFKWDILCSFLIKNLVIFVRATTAIWILFRNQMNRNVIGGKHNIPVHYVYDCASDSSGVVFFNPFKWDILYSFLFKNHLVVFVPSTTVEWISFCNQMNRKVVGGKHNVLLLFVDAKVTVLSSRFISSNWW